MDVHKYCDKTCQSVDVNEDKMHLIRCISVSVNG